MSCGFGEKKKYEDRNEKRLKRKEKVKIEGKEPCETDAQGVILHIIR
jgi:hypothetical protein